MATKQLYDLSNNKIYPIVECVDNLTSTSATSPLSANQGRVLKNLIDAKTSFKFQVVTSLPATGATNIIYLVKNDESTETNNIYDEYLYVNSKYEHLGKVNNGGGGIPTYYFTLPETGQISSTIVDEIRQSQMTADKTLIFVHNGEETMLVIAYENETTIKLTMAGRLGMVIVEIDIENPINNNYYPIIINERFHATSFTVVENVPSSPNDLLDYLERHSGLIDNYNFLDSINIIYDNGQTKRRLLIDNTVKVASGVQLWGTININGVDFKIILERNHIHVEPFYYTNIGAICITQANVNFQLDDGTVRYSFDYYDYILKQVQFGRPVVVSYVDTNDTATPINIKITDTDPYFVGMEAIVCTVVDPRDGLKHIIRVANGYIYDTEYNTYLNSSDGTITQAHYNALRDAICNGEQITIKHSTDNRFSYPIVAAVTGEQGHNETIEIVYFDYATYVRKFITIDESNLKLTITTA